ncbi:MAG: hypothetical protein NXI25_10055 [bacterium]|nr:hypothetical protein [bacterium]
MNLIRSLLAAIAGSILFYYMYNSPFLGEVLFFGLLFDSTPFFYSVLHVITTTLLTTLCIFCSMFLLKERRRENVSLIVVGVWAQVIVTGSLFPGLAFYDLLVGTALYVISVGILAPNFTDYKDRILSIANRNNQS